MGSEELRVPVGIPVETNAAAAADSIQALRDSAHVGQEGIVRGSSLQRGLIHVSQKKEAHCSLQSTIFVKLLQLKDPLSSQHQCLA